VRTFPKWFGLHPFSVKCRDPDGYIVEAWWEPQR
jgi:hypothetical protein